MPTYPNRPVIQSAPSILGTGLSALLPPECDREARGLICLTLGWSPTATDTSKRKWEQNPVKSGPWEWGEQELPGSTQRSFAEGRQQEIVFKSPRGVCMEIRKRMRVSYLILITFTTALSMT